MHMRPTRISWSSIERGVRGPPRRAGGRCWRTIHPVRWLLSLAAWRLRRYCRGKLDAGEVLLRAVSTEAARSRYRYTRVRLFFPSPSPHAIARHAMMAISLCKGNGAHGRETMVGGSFNCSCKVTCNRPVGPLPPPILATQYCLMFITATIHFFGHRDTDR